MVSSFALLSSFEPKQPMLFPVFLALQAALIRLQHSIEEVSEQAYNKSWAEMTLEPGKEGVTKGTRDATRMARVFSRAIIRSSNFNFSLFLVVFISPCLL